MCLNRSLYSEISPVKFTTSAANWPPGEAMKKIFRVIVVTLALVGSGAVAHAQQPKKVPRIGYLSSVDAASARMDST
jgi:hypothetical protein